MRQESRQDGNSRHVFESVAKRLVSQVRLCAAPGATPSERCAIGAGGAALGALASEKRGAASGAARRFQWLSLPRATPRPAKGTQGSRERVGWGHDVDHRSKAAGHQH